MMPSITVMTFSLGVFFAIVDSSAFQAVVEFASTVMNRVYGAHASKDDMPAFFASNFRAVSVQVSFKVTPNINYCG